MKTITDKNEYPNLIPDEIVRMGIALGGDALQLLINELDRSSEVDALEIQLENAESNENELINDLTELKNENRSLESKLNKITEILES